MQERAKLLYIFFHNHNYQGGSGKFIYKASILDNKQLLSNIIDHKATQVPHTTRNAFLMHGYVFCSKHPTILCIIAIASYIAIWQNIIIIIYNKTSREKSYVVHTQSSICTVALNCLVVCASLPTVILNVETFLTTMNVFLVLACYLWFHSIVVPRFCTLVKLV